MGSGIFQLLLSRGTVSTIQSMTCLGRGLESTLNQNSANLLKEAYISSPSTKSKCFTFLQRSETTSRITSNKIHVCRSDYTKTRKKLESQNSSYKNSRVIRSSGETFLRCFRAKRYSLTYLGDYSSLWDCTSLEQSRLPPSNFPREMGC